MIMNLTLDHITAITFLHLTDELSLFIIKFTSQLILNNINNWCIIKFIRTLRQILTTVHTLHHSGIHTGTCHHFILSCTAAEPTITLQPQTGTESASSILHSALNK